MSNNYVNMTVRAHTDGSRSYYEHDDRRVEFSNRNRRGKKPNWRRRRGHGGGGEGPSRVDADGDVSMAPVESGGDRQSRFTPYAVSHRKDGGNRYRRDDFRGQERREIPVAGSSGGRGGNQTSYATWNKVIVPYGRRLNKDYLLRSIAKNLNVQFCPYNYQCDGNAAVFFLEDKFVAAEVNKLSRSITSPEGQKITFIVKPSPPPVIILNEEVTQNLQAAVSRRYSSATGKLDLSFFHQDQDLKNKALYLPLWRPGIMANTMRIINDIVTNLVFLDLTGNKLTSLDLLGDVMKKLVNLKTILLGQNEITKFAELGRLKSLPLEELILNGNPLCSSYRDHSDYVE